MLLGTATGAGPVTDGCPTNRRAIVSEHTYRVVEVVGSSKESIEDAVQGAISRVAATTRHLDWFEVTEIRGHIQDGEVGHFQVGIKVGFRIEGL
jgi:flavin-binding protein dodecin